MDKYLGKRLDGRYEMRELIGVGGMAYVYKAYDSVDDRTVAVKILKDEFLSNEEFTRRFRNESKAIAILNHPNIVKVLDVGFGERLQYIVMEYIDGITLKEYLDQRKDLRWKEAVHFTVQILRALQHAHDKGIVHRDIKPQNIMLLSDGTIKVTDFGIARLTRSEIRPATEGEKAIGSVHYISPEQARGEITDEKTDLYSVGVMLYEMLTGRLPFDGDNAVSIAIMQMQTQPTLPHYINPEVPEGLEQITMKAMQKETDKRYQSAAEMLNDIDEFKRNPSIHFEYTYFVDDTPTRYVDAITQVRGEEPAETAPKAEEAPQEKQESGKKSVLVPVLAVLAAAIVVVAAVFVPIFLKFIGDTNSKEDIRVSDFVGLVYPDEVQERTDLKNYEVKVEQAYNAEYPAGTVFRQDPVAGTTIKMRGTLTLYVSLGSRQVAVSSLTPGETANMVRSRLTNDGFIVKEVSESSLEFKKGTVIRLSPEPGEQVQYGSEVTMIVSSGEPTAEPISMPNVLSMSVNDAMDKLVAAGFDRNRITVIQKNDPAMKDTVIEVTPDHTVMQQPDVNIQLTVSTGFSNVEIALKLPNTNTPVDLQFYVHGQKDVALTEKYTNIMPRDLGVIRFTVSVPLDSYKVSVNISRAGENQFAPFARFDVSAVGEGLFTLTESYPFDDKPATTTTPSTDSTTAGTTSVPTTSPTSPVGPSVPGTTETKSPVQS